MMDREDELTNKERTVVLLHHSSGWSQPEANVMIIIITSKLDQN